LSIEDITNPDVRNGMNCVIKNCGCGSFHDTRSQPAQSGQEIREKVLNLLIDLDTAFHKYEMDVCDELCPPPYSHRNLMERLDNMIAELRKGEQK
jgi:hypothetical protein